MRFIAYLVPLELRTIDKQNYHLVLKILKPDLTRNQVNHYYYWKREALVYRSGVLNHLPPGIRAPLCHEVEELSNGDIWIWLEDIAIESILSDWTSKQMSKISYLLGTFNGAYLSGVPLPTEFFICRHWMRSWIKVCTDYAMPIAEQKVIWESSLNVFNGNRSIWELYINNRTRVNRLLETLERLPRVFAHQDVHWDNIFVEQINGGDSLIALDWQFASLSGVGEELGRMFGYALLKGKIPINKAVECKEELLLNYIQGLRDVGWEGDADLVRFGFSATASLRFIMVMDKLLLHVGKGEDIDQNDKLNHLLVVIQMLLEMAEESWEFRSKIL